MGSRLIDMQQMLRCHVRVVMSNLPTELKQALVLAAGTAVGAVASGGSVAGGATAFNADMNNRQLSFAERQRAVLLAQQSGDKYTQKQIEDAMRNSPNKTTDETIVTGMVVSTTDKTGVYDKGAVFNAGAQGTNTIVQQLPNDGKVDATLADYIKAGTGGVNSPYAWSDVQLGKVSPTEVDPNAGIKMQVAPGWNTGANSAGLSSNLPSENRSQSDIDKSLNDTTKAIILAPMAAGAAVVAPGAALIGGGVNLGAQIVKGEGVSPTEVLSSTIMGPIGTAATEAKVVKDIVETGGAAAIGLKAGIGAGTNVASDSGAKIIKGEDVTSGDVAAKGLAGAATALLPAKPALIQPIAGEAINSAADALKNIINSSAGGSK